MNSWREDENRLEAIKMWIWCRMEEIQSVDRVRKEDVVRRVGEGREILKTIKRNKMNWLGLLMRGECLLKTDVEGN